jgi:hypothetical protein
MDPWEIKQNIKIMAGIFSAILVVNSLIGENATHLYNGMQMLLEGKCGFMSNRLWALVKLEHPVCAIQRKAIVIMAQVFAGDVQVIGSVVAIISAPVAAWKMCDVLLDRCIGVFIPIKRDVMEDENGTQYKSFSSVTTSAD